MGSIVRVWEPNYWKINFEGRSKLVKDDIIYEMIIGEGEDYGYFKICELISKENYENIINGKYFIEKYPYNAVNLLLFNDMLC